MMGEQGVYWKGRQRRNVPGRVNNILKPSFNASFKDFTPPAFAEIDVSIIATNGAIREAEMMPQAHSTGNCKASDGVLDSLRTSPIADSLKRLNFVWKNKLLDMSEIVIVLSSCEDNSIDLVIEVICHDATRPFESLKNQIWESGSYQNTMLRLGASHR